MGLAGYSCKVFGVYLNCLRSIICVARLLFLSCYESKLPAMKFLSLLLLTTTVSGYQFCFSQSISERIGNDPIWGIGYGRVSAGTGDMPGHQVMVNVQKRMTKITGFDVRMVGTLIQQNTMYAPGYEVYEKSNGVSLEADYHLFLNIGRVSFYPSVGPTVRYSHERHILGLSIAKDARGNIVNFDYILVDSKPLQIGYTLGLNLDVAITRSVILGIRGSTQKFNSGHQFTFIGMTVKSLTWRF